MILAVTGSGRLKSIDAGVAIAKALEDNGIDVYIEVAKYSTADNDGMRAVIGLVADGTVYGGNGIYGWTDIISDRIGRPYDDTIIFHEKLTTRHSFENRLNFEHVLSALVQPVKHSNEIDNLHRLFDICMAEISASAIEKQTATAKNTQRRTRI